MILNGHKNYQMRIKIILIVLIMVITGVKNTYWYLDDQTKNDLPLSFKSDIAEMTEEEFELMSATVEAESDRGESIDGRILIALTILNRVNSSKFPNSIIGVISEENQFQVYYEGTYKDIGRSDLSDQAVIEAVKLSKDDHPNVIYFNSIGYNYLGQPYAYVDGNYFETLEE